MTKQEVLDSIGRLIEKERKEREAAQKADDERRQYFKDIIGLMDKVLRKFEYGESGDPLESPSFKKISGDVADYVWVLGPNAAHEIAEIFCQIFRFYERDESGVFRVDPRTGLLQKDQMVINEIVDYLAEHDPIDRGTWFFEIQGKPCNLSFARNNLKTPEGWAYFQFLDLAKRIRELSGVQGHQEVADASKDSVDATLSRYIENWPVLRDQRLKDNRMEWTGSIYKIKRGMATKFFVELRPYAVKPPEGEISSAGRLIADCFGVSPSTARGPLFYQ